MSDATAKLFKRFFFMGEWAPPFFGASSATPPRGFGRCVLGLWSASCVQPVPMLGSLTDRWVINLLTGWSLTEAVVFMPLGQVSLQGFSGQTDRSDNAS